MNKFEPVKEGPCAVSFKLNKFEHVGRWGSGQEEGGARSCMVRSNVLCVIVT